MAGSLRVARGLFRPKFRFERIPHSPFCWGLLKSHCGRKSPAMPPLRPSSVQFRFALVTDVNTGLLLAMRPFAAFTYRFNVALSAVLPVPNRSSDPPSRGEVSG